MSNFDKRANYYALHNNKRPRGPLEAKLFALRRGMDGKIGRHVTEPMLVRLLGCTVAHYQRLERGKHPFKDEHLRKLADYYGADFDELKRLRSVEQLLLQAGFPDSDPRPDLWSALDYTEKLAPLLPWQQNTNHANHDVPCGMELVTKIQNICDGCKQRKEELYISLIYTPVD